ncbi:2Fe-2S iron-sulfur cluster-binding protein [Pseudomonas panipatensis]|uniref:Sarcosine oxidase subunit alpha n=1 Tax=Pseudomonas panipatensis TaxID=428992 RepID=A0A1G8L7H2_9PSED|nr:2Fe-2S iron-sulfur cluster-binding protein [Pseudomonas panipatensis]SDI51684.1 sarcosine oxidase subunit alpha [Pseudomonas panipatensis]SMP75532.1 sarcosine oxidase subunit alpha [Pseudomonas panipatensis]
MSAGVLRLPGATGQALSFSWNGRKLTGLEGDSVAEALLANGIRGLAFTRKAHRPMGLSGFYTTGVLARVDGVPNVRLDQCRLREGMQVSTQNCWPQPGFDLLRLARLVPAAWIQGGFEHTNLVPSGGRLFQRWEALLAFLAGVAEPASSRAQVAVPEGRRLFAEVLVIGAGPAGCAAANAVAAQGRHVLLVSRGKAAGGLARHAGVDVPGLDPRVECLFGVDVFGAYREGQLLLAAPLDGSDGALALEAGEVILATGRRPVPPLVPGTWLPGVMDARTALALAADRRIAPGASVAVLGTGEQDALAQRLRALGVNVVRVAPLERLQRISGFNCVRGIELEGKCACDAVVLAGTGAFDDSLSFQGSAQGRLQLVGGFSAYRRVGAAADADAALPVRHSAVLLCPCFDVSGAEVDRLLEQGVQDLEVIKRLTSCGMGPCQGQPCWHSLRDYVAARLGVPPASLNKPTLRPPRRALTVAQAAGLADVVEPLQ